MQNDRWVSYADAARILRMTPESVRQRARRESWRKTLGNDGKALILLPIDTARNTVDDTGGAEESDAPASRPAKRPEPDTAAAVRIQDLESRLAELRADLERERVERHEERIRADRLTTEVADLARQLARAVEEAGERERALRDRIETLVVPRSWWRRLRG